MQGGCRECRSLPRADHRRRSLGIGAAYHLQKRCPGRDFVLLEARDCIGGTWDLFRYPGVRSDSDMFTLGYSFRPWTGAKAITDGASILEYIRETAREYGVDRKIRFNHRVKHASWSSQEERWTVEAERGTSAEPVYFTCNFLLVCSGYYSYAQGYAPRLPRDRAVQGPHRPPAGLDRRHRLREQACGGDRQRRHSGHARARTREVGSPRDHAAAVTHLCRLPGPIRTSSPTPCVAGCRPRRPVLSRDGRMCSRACTSTVSASATPSGPRR